MPGRLAYDEAMLFSAVRLKIPDPELKQGRVEMITIHTNTGGIQKPWGVEGGFAIVYKFRTRSGQFRALRCFHVPMSQDTQFRHERIGAYFNAHAREITTHFKYHDQGILVKEQGQPADKVYPVIEMDWIDGLTLVERIDELCQRRDRAALKDLCAQWLNIIRIMQKARIAHGDLAGANVMVRPNGQLVLVDYDGVYIPEFAGLPQILVGQVDYQHPQMMKRPFNEHMDAFSALVIYTVLLALTAQPELWDRYTKRSTQNKPLDVNLMLTEQDFQEPGQSSLLRELEQASDQQVRRFAQELKQACLQPIDQVRFPFHLIDADYEKKQALAQLVTAVQNDDDEQITGAWQPILDAYQPALSYRQRVQLATQRVAALKRFRSALQQRQLGQIVASYDPILDASKSMTQQERELLVQARRFLEACNQDDDDAIVAASDSIQLSHGALFFSTKQLRRIAMAQQRKQALHKFREALSSQGTEQIADAYRQLQSYASSLSVQERAQGELAHSFMQAYSNEDDEAIIVAYEAIQNFRYRTRFTFSESQQQRVALAQQRESALARIHVALLSRRVQPVKEAYDPVLETSNKLTQEERAKLQLACNFMQAYSSDDDAALVAASDDVQRSPHQAFFLLTNQEEQRLELARRRQQAYNRFQSVLASRNLRLIAAAYEPILDARLSTEEYELAWLAQHFVACYNDDDRLLQAYEEIQRSAHKAFFKLTEHERQRIEMLRERERKWQQFEEALRTAAQGAQELGPQRIIDAYDDLPQSLRLRLTGVQRTHVEKARQALRLLSQLRQDKDDASLAAAYDATLVQAFPHLFSERDRARIDSAVKIREITQARRETNYAQALRLAREVPSQRGLNSQQPQLILAMRRVMQNTRLESVSACIQEQSDGNRLIVGWQWPQDDLIQHVVIFWDSDAPPRVPRQASGATLQEIAGYKIVDRGSNERTGRTAIYTGTHRCVYTAACAALYDAWDREAEVETWYFAPAIEQVAQVCNGVTVLSWQS